jgi:general secretion pathway protein K
VNLSSSLFRIWSTRTACKPVRGPPAATVWGRSSGLALIIVLWTLVLIAFIVTHITAIGRTEIRIASNLVANATAEAAADGAIFEAIFNLTRPEADQRWQIDGTAHKLAIGYSLMMVRVEDEAGWINPNTASPPLLEALLRVTGSDPESARRLATVIGEWVGSGLSPVREMRASRSIAQRGSIMDPGAHR